MNYYVCKVEQLKLPRQRDYKVLKTNIDLVLKVRINSVISMVIKSLKVVSLAGK